jgi:hypothetical protein
MSNGASATKQYKKMRPANNHPNGKCRPPLNSGLSPGFSYSQAIAEAIFANRRARDAQCTEPLSDMIFVVIVLHLYLALRLGNGTINPFSF